MFDGKTVRMKRRTYLALIGGVAVGVSGCLDYPAESTDDAERRQSRTAEQNGTVHEQGDRLAAVERETVVTLYDRGIDIRLRATQEYADGRTQLDNETYGRASMHLSRADAHYADAAEVWDEARRLASGMGHPDAAALIQSSQQHANAMASAASGFASAAYHYDNGDTATGDEHYQAGSAAVEEADGYEVSEGSRVKQSLQQG